MSGPRGTQRWRVVIAVVCATVLAGGLWFVVATDDEPTRAAKQEIAVRLVDHAFMPAMVQAHPGDTIVVTNDGTVVHSMVILELHKGTEVAPGETRSFELPDDVTGQYRFICDIPGHTEAGMVGTIDIATASIERPNDKDVEQHDDQQDEHDVDRHVDDDVDEHDERVAR